ncbi:MAG: tetratricopeptide repeat protein [Opitutales bacterium]|nr:tetratricopeptide repeat protein [Opitutales bacterium]
MEFSNKEYFGFATYARSKSGKWRLHFNWPRIFIILAVLGALAYAGLGLFFYYFLKGEASYGEALAYPASREVRKEVRRRLGNQFVTEAKTEFAEDKDFGKYFQKIRAGLIYSPYNPEARIDFASLLFYQKRTKEAFEFLKEGLPHTLNHRSYVQFFVRQSLDLAEDDVLVSAADALLPQFPLVEKILPGDAEVLRDNRLIVAVGAAQANLLRGRFKRAEKVLEDYGVKNTLSGRVLAAQIDWESGRREKALSTLKDSLRLAPGNDQISLLYALYLKEDGQLSEARDVLTRLALLKNDPTIRVKILTLFPGDENRLYREGLEKDFFDRYKNDSGALLVFAQYATDGQNYELVQKIYDHARKNALIDLPKFELLYLESLVLGGKSDQAIALLDELNNGNYGWVKNYQGVLDCLRALAYYSNNQANLGKINLERVMKNQSVPAARLIVLARRLDAFGFEDEARNVYENAYLLENNNQPVLLELIRYALRHEDVSVLVRYLPPLLETRRPPRSILEKVQNFLGSDRMLFVAKRESLINSVTEMLDETKSDQILPTDETTLKSWF